MTFDADLTRELDDLVRHDRRRDLDAIDDRPDGVDFASNDYLGLSQHPAILAAAHDGIERSGAGARAARLLGGGDKGQRDVEQAISDWLEAESALLFPTGYQANVGVVTGLVGPGDAVVLDELAHASSIDGARTSRARIFVHAHGDPDDLDRCLRAARSSSRRVLVLTEGVFSMDGDVVDLNAIARTCARHDARLIVDEAHATGVLGPEGSGAWSASGAKGPVIRIVTGGKALGVAGGFVVGSRAVRDVLANRARSFLFTTAPVPAVTAALGAAIEVCRGADRERDALRARATQLAERLDLPEPAAAILPFAIGSERGALDAEAHAMRAGFDVRAVRPPTVPDEKSRLRLVVHAQNTSEDVDRLAATLLDARPQPAEPTRAATGRCTFVVGTDTGIGKTVVSALLMHAHPEATYWKPVQTGDDCDTTTVRALARLSPSRSVEPSWHLPLPASPHEAAKDAGVSIDSHAIDDRLRALRSEHAHVIAELAGGLHVPYGDGRLQIDWLAIARPRIVLVARSGLGTLNHTLLSVESLRHRRLQPDAIVLVGPHHASNAATLRELTGVPLIELPMLDPLDAETLASFAEQVTDDFA